MPQILRIGPYIVYFWSNENNPLEPVHVHIAEGKATANATKLWITSTGKVILCNNNSKISEKILRKMMRLIEANTGRIVEEWIDHFGEVRYFC
ncbi:DUF4160 domain-containing protein [[Clostridium] aminophilum]|uniref:DUF4160 domain-containing protein n=1 Tax=[Clostridium] aminophilum TaxID=1526 RepID=UPI00331A5E74